MPEQHPHPIRFKHDTTSAALGVVPTGPCREIRVDAVRTPVRRYISVVEHVQTLADGARKPHRSLHIPADVLPRLIEFCEAAAGVLPGLPAPSGSDDQPPTTGQAA